MSATPSRILHETKLPPAAAHGAEGAGMDLDAAQRMAADPVVIDGMRAVVARMHSRVAAGATRLGWKLAITDPAAQGRLGIAGPLVGGLTGATRQEPPALRLTAGGRHALEVEVAVRLDGDLPEAPDVAACRAAIGGVGPAIEVADLSRAPMTLEGIFASDAFHELVVFGPEAAVSPALAASALRLRLTMNGGDPLGIEPALLIGDPAEIVAWAARLVAAGGERLRTGDRIICGSLNRPPSVQPGDAVVATLEPLGRLEVTFSS
jgi:2-keto-4-pentenoate hydratase